AGKREMEPTARPAPRAATVTTLVPATPVAATSQESSALPRTAMPAPVVKRELKAAARPVTPTVTPSTARPATPTAAAPAARQAPPVVSTPTAPPPLAAPPEERRPTENALLC